MSEIRNVITEDWSGHSHGEVEVALKGKLSEMDQSIEEAAQAGYAPPDGGIPKTDLAQSVQTSLDNADSAVQDSQYVHTDNNYTDSEKAKLSGLQNYDDAALQSAINSLQTALNALVNGQSVTDAIDTFNEVTAFLNGINTDDPTLFNQLKSLSDAITALESTLSSKANAADVYSKSQVEQMVEGKQDALVWDDEPTDGSIKPVKSGGIKTYVDTKVANASQGQTVVTSVDKVAIVDSNNTNSILTAPSSRQMMIAAAHIEALAAKFDALIDDLAGIAFTGNKTAKIGTLDWSTPAVPQYTISLGSIDSSVTVKHGTDTVSSPLTTTEGEVTLLLSSSNKYIDQITIVDGNSNPVDVTKTNTANGTEITFVLRSNVTLNVTAVAGITVNVSVNSGTPTTTYVQEETAAQVTINKPQHHSWALSNAIVVTYGATDITSSCEINEDNNGNKVVTLPPNLKVSDGKSVNIAATSEENGYVQFTLPEGTNVKVTVNNSPATAGTKYYNSEGALTVKILPEAGYKLPTTAPTVSDGTNSVAVSGDKYSGYTFTIATNAASETTYSITCGNAEQIETFAVTLPSAGSGIASVSLTDASGNSLSSPVVYEGSTIKVVFGLDAHYSLTAANIAVTMTPDGGSAETLGTESSSSSYYEFSNNVVTIHNVQGAIAVTATATAPTLRSIYTPLPYVDNITSAISIGNDVVTDDKAIDGEPLSIVLTPNTGYRITYFAVKVGSSALDTTVQGNSITENQDGTVTIEIANVTGIVDVDALASEIGTHTVTHKLLNWVANDNDENTPTDASFGYPQHSVNDNSSYSTVLSLAQGATSNNDVTVLMGGKDITSDVYDSSTGAISIAEVKGDVTIIATAYTGTIKVKTNAETTVTVNGTQYSLSSGDAITEQVNGSDVTRYYKEITPASISAINSLSFGNKSAILELDFGGLKLGAELGSASIGIFGAAGTANALANLTVLAGLVIKGTKLFRNAFANLTNLERLDTVGWSFTGTLGSATASPAENAQTFLNCSKITSLDLEGVNLSGTDAKSMFQSCGSLANLKLNRRFFVNVRRIDFAFRYCVALTVIDLSSVRVITSTMEYAINGCSALRKLILGYFNTSSTTMATGFGTENNNSSSFRVVCASTKPPKVNTSADNKNWLKCLVTSRVGGNWVNQWQFYVPDDSIDAYKAAAGWSSEASRIYKISSLTS